MRFDLKMPCKNCPFRRDDSRIKFRGRERAEEIAEGAYRNGFPCHKSAEFYEDEDGENSGYVPGPRSQACAGALAMFAQDAYGSPWPGIDNDEERLARIAIKLEPIFPLVFREEEFIAANFDPAFDMAEDSK